jgi:hypothetical protein
MIQPATLIERKAAGDKKIQLLLLQRRSFGVVSAADVKKWTMEGLQLLKIGCWLNFMLRLS